jgi:hypothetical protein
MANPNKIGVVIGTVLAGWHLAWAALVLFGWAQSVINFVFWAHMIQPIYVVKPFDPVATATLILVTFLAGYLFGLIGAILWNRLHRQP